MLKNMFPKIVKNRLVEDESGASLIEYSVLIGLITVIAVGTISQVGVWVGQQWTNLHSTVTNPGGGGGGGAGTP